MLHILRKKCIVPTEWSSDYWIGAKDVTGDNTWNWIDGEIVPGGTPYWAHGFPHHKNGAHFKYCGFINEHKRSV